VAAQLILIADDDREATDLSVAVLSAGVWGKDGERGYALGAGYGEEGGE